MFTIREGMKEDCIAIEAMIKEMADYQQLKDTPIVGHKQLEAEGFGDKRLFQLFVAEMADNKQLSGYVLYHNKYTTWTGRCVWMESLFVRSQYRKLGIGKALIAAVAKHVVDNSYACLEWDCGHWNRPSQAFYKGLGGINLTESIGNEMFRLSGQELTQLAAFGEPLGH